MKVPPSGISVLEAKHPSGLGRNLRQGAFQAIILDLIVEEYDHKSL